jgi:membrane AbrB-like protein
MIAAPQRPQHWRRGLAGVVVGAVAGYVCSLLHTPIPWMLGPLVTVAMLKVLGAPVDAPTGARQVGQWVIGTSLGLYFSPQVVRDVAGWWPLLIAGALFAVAAGYVGGLVLARLAGIDRTTALFASVPGGATEMSVLGERFGARVDRVATAQSLRILVVVIVIPFAYALAGAHGSDRYVPGLAAFDGGGFAMLMLATLAGAGLAQWLRVPNAFILGSLAVAIPLTAAGVHLSAVPAPVSNAGQCLLGCMLGSRFEPDFLRGAPRFIGSVVMTVLGAIVTAALFGVLLGWMSGLSPYTLALGLAPGGIAEMCITAKVLQLGVPLVTAFHVTRVVVLLLCTAPLFMAVRRWRRQRPEAR